VLEIHLLGDRTMATIETHNPALKTEETQDIDVSPLTYGPLAEGMHISSGTDFYKFTMSQFAYEHEPGAQATLTYKNRGNEAIKDYVDIEYLQSRLDQFRERGFTGHELQYLSSLTKTDGSHLFSDEYVQYLATHELPPVNVTINDDIEISTTGDWPVATFWETIIMSEVSEIYFEGYVRAHGLDVMEIYNEGDRRLSEKIKYLQEHPEIKVAEFGTRRRFSLRWQKHVIERLKNECPQNLIGTSNTGYADVEDLKPIGTYAHELPMTYAALADGRGEDIRASQMQLVDDWLDFYGEDFAIALPDTFGAEVFFEDLGRERAERLVGSRHDSGDPIAYGRMVVNFYQTNGIDPTTKKILFSDGLDIPNTVDAIHREFEETIDHPYGVGTNLTNDLGVKALNQVVKVTAVNGIGTVKLAAGKHTGSPEQIKKYEEEFAAKEL
jgi:nicotinate phosphoribosyltransferase